MHNQPVPVAADVEDQTIVANEIDRGTELRFHVRRTRPLRPTDSRMPRAKRGFRARMVLPEQPQRALRNDLHPALSRMFPNMEQEENAGQSGAPPRGELGDGDKGSKEPLELAVLQQMDGLGAVGETIDLAVPLDDRPDSALLSSRFMDNMDNLDFFRRLPACEASPQQTSTSTLDR